MQNRVRKIANFFAFNILFFAVYLNFMGKSKEPVGQPVTPATAFSTTLVNQQAQKTVAPMNAAMATLK